MTEKRKKSILASMVVISMLLIGAFGLYLVSPPSENGGGFGTLTVSAAPADPGAGAGGILEIFIIDHANRPASYNTNISESASYVLGHGSATGFSIEIPYNTPFDIVVWCRANKTQAYDTAWNLTLIRCNITSADLSIPTLTGMSETQIGSNSTYLWVNYWIDNSGNGYQINRGATANIDTIKYEYYG